MARIPFLDDKDPDESRSYGIDWSDHLGTATISSSTWTVVTGSVTVAASSNTTTTTTVRLNANSGTIGETCELVNQIVTSGSETLEQSVRIRIRKR